jgi:hypothetical protein
MPLRRRALSRQRRGPPRCFNNSTACGRFVYDLLAVRENVTTEAGRQKRSEEARRKKKRGRRRARGRRAPTGPAGNKARTAATMQSVTEFDYRGNARDGRYADGGVDADDERTEREQCIVHVRGLGKHVKHLQGNAKAQQVLSSSSRLRCPPKAPSQQGGAATESGLLSQPA